MRAAPRSCISAKWSISLRTAQIATPIWLPAYRVTLHTAGIRGAREQVSFTISGDGAYSTLRPRRTDDDLMPSRPELFYDGRMDAFLDGDLCHVTGMRIKRAREVLDRKVGRIDRFLEVQAEKGVRNEKIQ